MSKFEQKVLIVLGKLQYLCDVVASHRHNTKKGITYYFGDMFPPVVGQEELLHVIQYLKKNGLNISITFDIFNSDPREKIEAHEYADEDSVTLGLIKGKNIEAIRKVIENNIKKLNPQMEVQSSQGVVGSPNIKEAKQKFTSKLKIVDGYLYFGEEKIATERGQKTMTQLFLSNAKASIGGKVKKKGKPLAITELQQAGSYINVYAFRDGLKKLRRKFKKEKWPVTIENSGTKMYQMEICYNKKSKTQRQ